MLKLEDYIVINKNDLAEFINVHFGDCSAMDDTYCSECGECKKENRSADDGCRYSCELNQNKLALWFIEHELIDYILNSQTLANLALISVYENILNKENHNEKN